VLPGLFRGDIAVRSKDDEERYGKAIDCESRWLVYRFTWVENEREPGKMDKLYREFEGNIANLVRNKLESQFTGKHFAERSIVHIQEVVKSRKPIARVNAARLLPKLAELGVAQNSLVDACVEMIKDPDQNEGVKLYALRGLRDVLAWPQPKPPQLPREKEEKAIQAALDLMLRSVQFASTAPREEVEGFRSLRREAVRAVGQAKYPTIGENTRVGLALLKMVGRDGYAPEPRIDERFEAALGVTRLKPALDPTYQPDYAISVLAQFIAELGTAYQKRADVKDELRPYRIYAARLTDALETMRPEARAKTPSDEYIRRVLAECSSRVLSKMETGGTAAPFDLVQWLERNPPPRTQLHAGDAASVVQPPAAGNTDDAASSGR
jgi:hypothetical protein